MQSEKNETINEKGLLEIVNIWISENPDHFGTAKKDYRPAHISRCMRYLHAPDEYLIKKTRGFTRFNKMAFSNFTVNPLYRISCLRNLFNEVSI